MTAAHPPLLTRPLRRGELVLLDAILAAGLAVVCVYAALEAPVAPVPGVAEPVWLSVLVGLGLGLPVAVRRLWPLSVSGFVLLVSTAAVLLAIIPDYAATAPTVALGCVLYVVGVSVTTVRSVIAVAVCVVSTSAILVAVSTSPQGSPDASGVALAGLVMAVAWIIGRAVRDRRAYAIRAAEQLTDRAVSAERLRIARELHDIVAHSMSLIAVKAAIANHVADERPQETREALRVIETTSRGALTEMRRTLGGLRDATTLAPTPGLADLPALAERAASAGIRVRIEVTPDGATLPEGLGLAVFRIVQESLTNVVKHAAAANCHACVVVEADQVRVEVVDDGARANQRFAGGQGIIGMRERAALYHGDLRAGPRSDGGFAVVARLRQGLT